MPVFSIKICVVIFRQTGIIDWLCGLETLCLGTRNREPMAATSNHIVGNIGPNNLLRMCFQVRLLILDVHQNCHVSILGASHLGKCY